MSVPGRLVGPGADRANVICEVCCATFYTAAVCAADPRGRPAGRCEHCGGPLWPILADAERDVPHAPAGVYDLEAFRRRRR